jgi:hypothetical protein
VINPIAGATSANATLTITADTTKPSIVKAEALGTPNASGPTPYLIKIIFSERLDATSSGTPGNYVPGGGATVGAVSQSDDATTVFLQTSGLTPGAKYTVNVSGVADQAQTPNTMNPAAVEVFAPVLSTGMYWDHYNNIANGVLNLMSDASYPSAPYTNLTTLTFNSGEITGGNLENRAGFGAAYGDNYGASLSGWITPPVTTNYYFYLASDDASELHISTDANPANWYKIAEETGCCHGFQEPGNPTTSTPIALTGGQNYFIQALQTEGAGGDYVRVAWKMEGDPTASTNLTPIASTYLKAYQPVPAPKFNQPSLVGNTLTISWTGTGTLYSSSNLFNWVAVPGNPPSPITVNVTLEPSKYYRIIRQ